MSDELTNTLIAGLVTIIVALIGAVAGREGYQRIKRNRTQNVDVDEREAVERYANDPGRFVADVLKSNHDYAEQVAAYAEEVKGLRKEVAEFTKSDRLFRNALARWMLDILNAWGAASKMPYPRDGDDKILADVIPSALEATRPQGSKWQQSAGQRQDESTH